MIRRLWSLYRPYSGWLALGVLLALLALLANISLLALSGWFITSMALAGVAGASMNYFSPAAMIRGLAILRTAGRYSERVVTHEATFRLIARLRSDFYARIEPLAPAALSRHRSGDLLSLIQKDVERLDAVYLRIALPIIVAILSVLICTVFMAIHSPLLALINLALLLAGGVALPLWINHLSAQPGRQQVRLSSAVRTQAIDGIQGMAELLAYGADQRHAEHLQQVNQQWLDTQDALNRPQSLATATQGLLSHLAVWLVLALSIPLVANATLPPANLAMLALFTLASFETIAPLPQAFGLLSETAEATRRLFDLSDTPALITEPEHPGLTPEHPTLVFRQVSLRYPSQTEAALKQIDLDLPAGQRILIQGPSGSGKSSLVNLLLRFNDPSSGAILADGIPLTNLCSEHWRARIAVVSQHTQLISGTLRDNLLLAQPAATEAELDAACERAQLSEMLKTLPDGYDTWLGETGTKVSGGQARRIAIARALLKQAPILILDEPTEGLDPTTERHLIEALLPLMQDRTVLLISHRALHLPGFDRQLMLDRGRLGDHLAVD